MKENNNQGEQISDLLRYMTIRIRTSKAENTEWSGSGTGFLYVGQRGNSEYPVLITNKHVLDGAVVVGFDFHLTTDGNKTPVPGPGRLFAVKLKEILVSNHPDPNVDLVAIALAHIILHAPQEGWHPYIKCLSAIQLPNENLMSDLTAIEEVLMIGYPNGLSDPVNNFPVVRRGITSTPYKTDYQGRKQFLADIAVYPGSSGSPIVLLNEGTFQSKNGFAIGTRFALLGVLYAGHTETLTGEIVAAPVPTALKPVAKTTHIINLGICIKAAMIEDIIEQMHQASKPNITYDFKGPHI